MKGKIKAIEGVYPITRAEGVYISDNKTLKQAIDSGEFNNNATTNANFVTNAYVKCGDLLFNKKEDKSIEIDMNKNLSLYRIFEVSYSNGTSETLALWDILPCNLKDGELLTWSKLDGFTISTNSSLPYTKVLLAYNFGGNIVAGSFLEIFNKKYPSLKFDKEYNVNAELVYKGKTGRTLHSMFVVNDELITLEAAGEGGVCNVYSLPNLTHVKSFNSSFIDTNSDGSSVNLRLVTCDYSIEADALIMGNGTADGSEEGLYGYIFYDAKNWKNYTETVTFQNTAYTKLDFHTEGLFSGETTAKIVWSELPDICYLTTSNLKCVHKILLGVGTNKLEHGVYSYDSVKRYNGTYKIIKSFIMDSTIDNVGNKDCQYYKGCMYYPVKWTSGGLRIYKTTFNINGTMSHDLINFDPISEDGSHKICGSPEGIVIFDNKIITSGDATTEYFYVLDLI